MCLFWITVQEGSSQALFHGLRLTFWSSDREIFVLIRSKPLMIYLPRMTGRTLRACLNRVLLQARLDADCLDKMIVM